MVFHSVSLTSIFSLFLKDFKVALSKDLFVHFAAVIEQFCAESTEFEIDWLGSLTLRLQINLGDLGTEVTVEI